MRAASIEMSAQQIYSQSKAGDMVMRRVVDTYIHRLGTGVVNVANGFRPQLVILGGELPEDQETVLGPIREMLQKECFGREHGDVPEIVVSALGKNAGVIGAASMV
jgi:predicted NBD/HSP70 family sugar kinase